MKTKMHAVSRASILAYGAQGANLMIAMLRKSIGVALYRRGLSELFVVLCAALLLSACTQAAKPASEAPPAAPSAAPSAANVASGSYLTAVLGGTANDALTNDAAAALPDTVMTDSEVTALLAADWWKPFVELAASTPQVLALLSAVAPAYDKHVPATAFTVRIRETAMPSPNDPFIPPIALGSYSVGAGTVAAISTHPTASRTKSCYLTTNEVDILLGQGDPALAQRVAACVSASSHTGLSTMQAVEVARVCGSAGCTGSAARQKLAAVGLTVLHRLVADTADQLSNIVLAGWFTGTWYGLNWGDDDDDGIGDLHEYAVMQIRDSSARFVCCHGGDEQQQDEVELGPWSHRETRAGGEFYSGDEALEYRYLSYPLHSIRGGTVDHDWWLARVGSEVVGTWSGMSDSDSYELVIGADGTVVLTTSGVTMNGIVVHEQHHEDEDEEDDDHELIFDQDGYPVLNYCGNLLMAFPSADEVQNWRYCIDSEGNMNTMYVDIPPYRPHDWDLDVELNR